MSNVIDQANVLDRVRGMASQPDQEIFKIGPEVIQDFIGRVVIMMGGTPEDIKDIKVGQDKKRLRILAILEKDSAVFVSNEERPGVQSGLALMGAAEIRDDAELTEEAKQVLRELGYSYRDENNREVLLVDVTEYKKGVEIEFNAEVTMAIITDSDFSDKYFIVDAVEEVLKKKKYNSYKFKDKKQTIVFARVQRSFKGNEQGFDPEQVTDWKTAETYEDDDEDDDYDDDEE